MKDYKKLNQYLSNLAVLNIKLHNLHWNVVGKEFMQLHTFTETLYEDVFKKFDDVAELIKIRGEKPLAKMADYLQNASISELDDCKFSSTVLLQTIQDDLTKMKNLATEIRNDAEADGDFGIVADFEDHVADYSKNLWFIRSILQS